MTLLGWGEVEVGAVFATGSQKGKGGFCVLAGRREFSYETGLSDLESSLEFWGAVRGT